MKTDFHKPIMVGDVHSFGFYFTWGQETVGFGEISGRMTEEGVFRLDSECMGKEWCRRALHAAVDKLIDGQVELV